MKKSALIFGILLCSVNAVTISDKKVQMAFDECSKVYGKVAIYLQK